MNSYRVDRSACPNLVHAPLQRSACAAAPDKTSPAHSEDITYWREGVVLASLLAGFAGLGSAAQAREPTGAVVIPLVASSFNAGRVGHAAILPQGNATRIVLWFSGVPNAMTLPVHVYTYVYEGTCNTLPAKPVISLNDRALGTAPSGSRGPSLSRVAALPMEELLNGRFALALRSAPFDGDQLLYCGELRS